MEQEQLESLWLMWQPITRCGKQRIRQIPDNLSAFGIYCPIFYCDTYSFHETTTKSFDNDTVTQLELAGNDLANLAG
jgi:hypothetical protein